MLRQKTLLAFVSGLNCRQLYVACVCVFLSVLFPLLDHVPSFPLFSFKPCQVEGWLTVVTAGLIDPHVTSRLSFATFSCGMMLTPTVINLASHLLEFTNSLNKKYRLLGEEENMQILFLN